MANTLYREGAVWRKVGEQRTPGVVDPGPPDPPPPLPTIPHGSALAATYDLVRQQIGVPAGVTLTPTAATTWNPGTYEGLLITGTNRFNVGHTTLRNCKIQSSAGAGNPPVFATTNGAWVTLENCEVVQRSMGSGGNSAITARSGASLELRRTIVRGGYDQIFLAPPRTPGLIPTGDATVPMAQILVEECWIGDNERTSGSHSDLMQIDGLNRGYIVVRRNRFAGFSLPIGSDPLTTWVTNQSTATMASTCIIATGTGNTTGHIVVEKNYFEGGNYIVQMDDITPPNHVRGNLWGLRMQFGPLRGGSFTSTDNRWAVTGTTGYGLAVTAGQLLPGSGA